MNENEKGMVDLYNQEMKELQDSKKQIEEIARTTCNYNAKNFESCVECTKGGLLSCDRLVQAEKLYKAGYRKILENAVVLTNENEIKQYEWSKMLDKMGVFKFADKVRKETAEKVAERLKELFPTDEVMLHLLPHEQLHKSIDEICKEITEGKV